MRDWPALHEHTNAQRFVTRAQVRDLNIPTSSFTAHTRRVGWRATHRGLWVPAGMAWDHRDAASAAAAVLGDEALVTGASALFLQDIATGVPEHVEVLVPASRTPVKRDGICIHHTTTFDQVRSVNSDGLRLAATARAVCDFACHASVDELCGGIATALRLRQTTMAQLRQELDRRKRFPGRRNLRIALGLLAGETVHSAAERTARRLLRAAGHVPHPRPYVVGRAHGGPLAEIDVAFSPLLYGIEVDGPHHLLPEVASADRHRDRQLAELGWKIDRFWWDEIEQRQAWFVQEVTKQLRRLDSR